MIFLKFPCFLYNPEDVGNLISSSSSLSKPSLDIWKFLVRIMLNANMQDLSTTLLAWEMSAIVRLHILWYYPSWELGWELTFSSPVATAGSSRFADILSARLLIECKTPSFTVLNSSTRFPLPSLSLLISVLPKAHLTSHLRISGSGWLTTPSWLSGSLTYFLFSSSVYSFHLFLISSYFTRSLHFIYFIILWFCPLLWPSLGKIFPIFLMRFLVFPLQLFSFISKHCLLTGKKVFFNEQCLKVDENI